MSPVAERSPGGRVGGDRDDRGRERAMRGLAAGANVTWLPLAVALVLLCVAFTVLSPGNVFFSADNFAAIAVDMAATGIMAIGATFVLTAAGIDLSVGGVLAFSSILGARVMAHHTSTGMLLLGIAVMIAAGLALGLVNGVLIERLSVPGFIATLGTLGMTIGGGYLLSNGVAVSGIPPGLQDQFGVAKLFGVVPLPAIVFLVLALAASIAMRKTRFGCYTVAIGSNREAASRAGIRVRWHLIKVYALAGCLAGVAGVIDVARFSGAAVSAHQTDVLPVISAVVIGGTSLFGGVGTIGGTVIGVALLSVLTNGLVIVGLQSFWQQIATGAILIVAVMSDQHRARLTLRRRAASAERDAA